MKMLKDLGMKLPKKTSKQKRRFSLIECDCGIQFEVRHDDFKSGKIKSCGCKQHVTHGLSDHKLYAVHSMLKQRCDNPNHEQFKDWGGRGISYCDEWKTFEPFYKWAMLNGYCDGLELDREDNDGNYEPGNCRFVTSKVNMSNRRCSVKN